MSKAFHFKIVIRGESFLYAHTLHRERRLPQRMAFIPQIYTGFLVCISALISSGTQGNAGCGGRSLKPLYNYFFMFFFL